MTRRLPVRHVPIFCELSGLFVGFPDPAGSNPAETIPRTKVYVPGVYIFLCIFRLANLLAMSKRQLSITELLQ